MIQLRRIHVAVGSFSLCVPLTLLFSGQGDNEIGLMASFWRLCPITAQLMPNY